MAELSKKNARRSPCPVACALDILGDRWTLLVLRDLYFGKKRYGELAASFENIPTNILAERLKRMTRAGLVVAAAYQQRPARYEYALTPKGKDLLPTLKSLSDWGLKYIPHTEIHGKFSA
jgi:DNA-binding HxlR family transcriptional regulator